VAEAASNAIQMLNCTVPEGSTPTLTIRYHGKDPNMPSDNLYVKGLPTNFTQDNLQALFSECGSVRRSRILMPPLRHVALDSAALVQMGSIEEAARVIQTLNGRNPAGFGPVMMVRYAEAKAETSRPDQSPTDNLYVKGLPLGTPDFLLRAVFQQYGHVVRLKVLEPRGSEALDCAALVQLACIEEAQAAVEALHGRVLAAPMPPMRVRYAGKDQQPGSNLYIAGLPMTVHEQQLRSTFAQCGVVVRLRLLVQPGRPETHALVQMGSVDEAEYAIQKLNGSPPDSLGPTLVVRFATNRAAKGRDEACGRDQAGNPVAGGAGGCGGCGGGGGNGMPLPSAAAGGPNFRGGDGMVQAQHNLSFGQQVQEGGPSPLDQLAALQLAVQPHAAAVHTGDASLDFATEFDEDMEMEMLQA